MGTHYATGYSVPASLSPSPLPTGDMRPDYETTMDAINRLSDERQGYYRNNGMTAEMRRRVEAITAELDQLWHTYRVQRAARWLNPRANRETENRNW